jgi:hypothetical protein
MAGRAPVAFNSAATSSGTTIPNPNSVTDSHSIAHSFEVALEPIKTPHADSIHRIRTDNELSRTPTEEELFRALSSRITTRPSRDEPADHGEIENLLSRIFGESRQAGSDEKTKHKGVVFKDLTVKGLGLGASLQPTNTDIFLGPYWGIRNLLSGRSFQKAPVRTILNGFTGCIRPSELLLVLGRPGAGCSTFLKVLGNQRAGFEEITGDVRYGGEDWTVMQKRFRGEVLYNGEDDLHYATLTVKETLEFALKTRTPGKESRVEGESRESYVSEFLRVVSKVSCNKGR